MNQHPELHLGEYTPQPMEQPTSAARTSAVYESHASKGLGEGQLHLPEGPIRTEIVIGAIGNTATEAAVGMAALPKEHQHLQLGRIDEYKGKTKKEYAAIAAEQKVMLAQFAHSQQFTRNMEAMTGLNTNGTDGSKETASDSDKKKKRKDGKDGVKKSGLLVAG